AARHKDTGLFEQLAGGGGAAWISRKDLGVGRGNLASGKGVQTTESSQGRSAANQEDGPGIRAAREQDAGGLDDGSAARLPGGWTGGHSLASASSAGSGFARPRCTASSSRSIANGLRI